MTITEIQPQTVRAHELFGDFWFNSEPVIISALRGRVILVNFWDYTCSGSQRALPYVKEWSTKYEQFGLVVIGVHTPKFPFGKNPELVQRAIERHEIRYPVVTDNEGIIAHNYASRTWPAFFIIDKHGFIRYSNTAGGNYTTTERILQALLYDAGAEDELPLLMEPLRDEDRDGSLCYRSTPELFAGYVRGSIGNVEGFSPESTVEYTDPAIYMDDRIYAVGSWMNDRNSLRHIEESDAGIILNYHAVEVNAVLTPEGGRSCELVVRQDDAYLVEENKGRDVHIDTTGRSLLLVSEPRLYNLVRNPRYGEHVLKLDVGKDGVSLFSFNFVSGVIAELISKN